MWSDLIILKPIGYVKTYIADTDIPHQCSQIPSELILFEDYSEALEGIEALFPPLRAVLDAQGQPKRLSR
jgi:tRNA (Thr-GGU) A37 N-methylase